MDTNAEHRPEMKVKIFIAPKAQINNGLRISGLQFCGFLGCRFPEGWTAVSAEVKVWAFTRYLAQMKCGHDTTGRTIRHQVMRLSSRIKAAGQRGEGQQVFEAVDLQPKRLHPGSFSGKEGK